MREQTNQTLRYYLTLRSFELLFGSQATLNQMILLAMVIIDANKPYTESSNTTGVSQNYFDVLLPAFILTHSLFLCRCLHSRNIILSPGFIRLKNRVDDLFDRTLCWLLVRIPNCGNIFCIFERFPRRIDLNHSLMSISRFTMMLALQAMPA